MTGKTLAVRSALPASGTLTASYTYDNQGALTSMVYPASAAGLQYYAPTLTYTLDAMERPTGLTDNIWATGVSYNAANQSSVGGRSYNNLLQVTQVGSMTYNYPAGNNGQIASSVDATTGETITYQYDALKRLAGASSNKNWGESYGYDGWGNLLQMNPSGTAGAPTLSVTADPATNRLPFYYDSNNVGDTLPFHGDVEARSRAVHALGN